MHLHSNRIKVIVAGGGYAGLATVISLRQHCPNAEIILFDPSAFHLRRTHLHESFRQNSISLRIPFAHIIRRFQFRHIQAALEFNRETLQQWQKSGKIDIKGSSHDFDYLVIATGAKVLKPKGLEGCLCLDDLASTNIRELLRTKLYSSDHIERTIHIVGAGATGIQFLFEINETMKAWRRKTGRSFKLRLVNPEEKVLSQFPPGFHRYVSMRMRLEGIEHDKNLLLMGQTGDKIKLKNCKTGQEFNRYSPLTLVFLGQTPHPDNIQANLFGQVTLGGEVLDHIFTAGDCSEYSGYGANTMSAQVAVRKGKKVARNIQIHAGSTRSMERYLFQELGYFVSLGPLDGVGWLGLKANVVAALPAFAIKEAVEAQFDLFLAGLDTYLL